MKFRDNVIRFMGGRYGTDQLNIALLIDVKLIPPIGRNELDIKECARFKKDAESVFLKHTTVCETDCRAITAF